MVKNTLKNIKKPNTSHKLTLVSSAIDWPLVITARGQTANLISE